MKTVKGYIERKSMLYETGVEYVIHHEPRPLFAHSCKYPAMRYRRSVVGQVPLYEIGWSRIWSVTRWKF